MVFVLQDWWNSFKLLCINSADVIILDSTVKRNFLHVIFSCQCWNVILCKSYCHATHTKSSCPPGPLEWLVTVFIQLALSLFWLYNITWVEEWSWGFHRSADWLLHQQQDLWSLLERQQLIHQQPAVGSPSEPFPLVTHTQHSVNSQY